jgi:hypothetical protein
MIDETIIREIADRQAITDQIYRYCRSMDRRDIPLGHKVFHEDATADYGPGSYTGTGRGFIDWVAKVHTENFDSHSHQITNVIINLDGDRAGSESYVTVALRFTEDGRPKLFRVWARYLDTWSRRDGHWAIDHRTTIIDLDEERDLEPRSPSYRGDRGPGDPSYAVLGEA